MEPKSDYNSGFVLADNKSLSHIFNKIYLVINFYVHFYSETLSQVEVIEHPVIYNIFNFRRKYVCYISFNMNFHVLAC